MFYDLQRCFLSNKEKWMLQSHLNWGPVQTPCACSPPPRLHCCASAPTHLQQETVTQMKAAAWKQHHTVDSAEFFWKDLLSALLAFLVWPLSTAVSSLFLLSRAWPQGGLPFSSPLSQSPLTCGSCFWSLAIRWKQLRKPWARARSAAVCPLPFLKLNKKTTEWDKLLPVRRHSLSSLTVWLHPALIADWI